MHVVSDPPGWRLLTPTRTASQRGLRVPEGLGDLGHTKKSVLVSTVLERIYKKGEPLCIRFARVWTDCQKWCVGRRL